MIFIAIKPVLFNLHGVTLSALKQGVTEGKMRKELQENKEDKCGECKSSFLPSFRQRLSEEQREIEERERERERRILLFSERALCVPVIVQPLEVGHLALELKFRHLAKESVPFADDLGKLALEPLDLRILAADELVLLLEDALDVRI